MIDEPPGEDHLESVTLSARGEDGVCHLELIELEMVRHELRVIQLMARHEPERVGVESVSTSPVVSVMSRVQRHSR